MEHQNEIVTPTVTKSLMQDLRQIIEQARGLVATTANYALTTMYWHIGERINREILGNQRAKHGKQIVAAVSRQLREDFGSKGFDEKSIRRMMQFAILFPDFQMSHFVEVMPLKDALQREFYLTLAASERWSMRQLRKEIDGMLYERTAISSKPEKLILSRLAILPPSFAPSHCH